MKKILLIIVCAIIVAALGMAAFLLLRPKHEQDAQPPSDSEKTYADVGDVNEIYETIKFLRFSSLVELKEFSEDHNVFIQTSDDPKLFGIGEIYVDQAPVVLFYRMKDDESFDRFDGSCSISLKDKTAAEVAYIIRTLNDLVCKLFYTDKIEHSMYDEAGIPMYSFDESVYLRMLEGKATYGLTLIDEKNTYWYATAKVTDGKQIDFSFFRCFDSERYKDSFIDVDLRYSHVSGEE